MSILTASCKTIRVNECYKCIELPTIGLECPGLRALYSHRLVSPRRAMTEAQMQGAFPLPGKA